MKFNIFILGIFCFGIVFFIRPVHAATGSCCSSIPYNTPLGCGGSGKPACTGQACDTRISFDCDFIPISCANGGLNYISGCSTSTPTPPPPPPNCTGDGACMPSGGTCCSGSNYYDSTCGSLRKCGTIVSTGGGGSCSGCSDWCAGADQCFASGGVQVSSPCSFSSCAPNTSPCKVCSTGGGSGVTTCPTSPDGRYQSGTVGTTRTWDGWNGSVGAFETWCGVCLSNATWRTNIIANNPACYNQYNLTAVCGGTGNTATISWNPLFGQGWTTFRLNNITTNPLLQCPAPGQPGINGDVCQTFVNNGVIANDGITNILSPFMQGNATLTGNLGSKRWNANVTTNPGQSYSITLTRYQNLNTGNETFQYVPDAGATINFTCSSLGNINVLATQMNGGLQCTNAKNGTKLDGTQISVNGLTPLTQTQLNGNPVSWLNVSTGSKFLSVNPGPGYSLDTLCYERSSNPGTLEEASSLFVQINSNETTSYYAGFVSNNAWSQVNGGDLISCGNIVQQIPSTATDRFLNVSGPGGYPGIVQYSTSGTFDIDPDLTPNQYGYSFVSDTNWLNRHDLTDICTTNWYLYFANSFEMVNAPASTVPNPLLVTKNDLFGGSTNVIKRIDGDITISESMIINDGESLVLFVDGTLTLEGNITRLGSGFAAFITSNGIIVEDTVGSSDSTPSLQGIYITNGAFETGNSTQLATERLVVNGIVMAHSIELQRTLISSGNNATIPAEEFIYDPQLLFIMPDDFMQHHISWREAQP